MLKITAFFFIVFPSICYGGWGIFGESCLDDAEDSSKLLKKCETTKLFGNDCVKYEKAMKLAVLECKKDGIEERKIYAAIELGEQKMVASSKSSPYKRITDSLKQKPYYIEAVYENYLPYSDKCSMGTSKLFKLSAYSVRSNQANFIVVPVESDICLPITSLDEKFPIITGEQRKRKLKYVVAYPIVICSVLMFPGSNLSISSTVVAFGNLVKRYRRYA